MQAFQTFDDDGGGSIDFAELCLVMTKAGPPQGATGISFKNVIKRAKDGGPPLLFRTDESAGG